MAAQGSTPAHPESTILPDTIPGSSPLINSPKQIAPIVLLVIFCLAIAYMVGYVLYRHLMVRYRNKVEARLLEELNDAPESPHWRWSYSYSRITDVDAQTPASEKTVFPDTPPLQKLQRVGSKVRNVPLLDFTEPVSPVEPTYRSAPPLPKRFGKLPSSKSIPGFTWRFARMVADPKLAPVRGPLRPLRVHIRPRHVASNWLLDTEKENIPVSNAV
ncbi:hypothetical protein BV22DRAFT_1125062 [Leucogyrophana mollusca]|uniref:Uncharacterized protein n=1 Tax=Leucogyrophana mollusca TaxID=85980 RepID=A0ACB8BYU7_9AGAM|nr:hypothetical protein BV22DRAFT_1125062 [Leucogyrophana mollusca]